MKIGIPKEVKDHEGRVAITPSNVRRLVDQGHEVLIEANAGLGSGFSNEEYIASGGVLGRVEEAWDRDLVLKVKEPLESEYRYLNEQILFTFLHLSGVPKSLTEALLSRNTTGVAYETVEDDAGRLPLLAPMSAVAGNMAALVGAYYLGQTYGGKGVQLGEVLGIRHGKVLVLGDGIVGYHAAKSAHGLGAEVVVAGLDPQKGNAWLKEFGAGFSFVMSSSKEVDAQIVDTDLVVGAVLRRGARADYVVTESQVKQLSPGSVVVDVSIDQGGCIETSKPTSHTHPVFAQHGVIHYCVTNMPGAYPRTSTVALSNAVLPYALKLADQGLDALKGTSGLAKGLHTYQGKLYAKSVAEDLSMTSLYEASL
jgi:alanine dehydrogenase